MSSSPFVDPSIPSERSSARGRRKIRDRIVELRRVKASALAPNPKNWRRHPDRQRSALKGLLKQIGFADALLAREEAGQLILIDGHLRQSLDPEAVVPVLVLDLTREEGDVLLASLDPLAGMAQPDPGALAELLSTVQAENAAVRAFLDEVAASAGLPRMAGLTEPDDVPALPAVPDSRPGDLWVLGEHRLLCGDTRSPEDLARLMDGERADLLWTDPPYGVSYVGKTPQALTIQGDTAPGLEALLTESFAAIDPHLRPGAALYVAHAAGPPSLVFAARFVAQGWRLHQTLVWVKDVMVLGKTDYHYRHEPLLFGYKPAPGRWGRGAQGWHGGNDQTSVFEVPRPKLQREHPTAKPVELVGQCLANSSGAGEAVLDPFLGSGTTLIACEQLGRRGFGMEVDPAYCDVVVRRWESFTGSRAHRMPLRPASPRRRRKS